MSNHGKLNKARSFLRSPAEFVQAYQDKQYEKILLEKTHLKKISVKNLVQWHILSLVLAEEKSYEEAFRISKELCFFQRNNLDYLYLSAFCLYKLSRFSEANELFEQVLLINANVDVAIVNRIHCLIQLGEIDGVVTLIESSTKNNRLSITDCVHMFNKYIDLKDEVLYKIIIKLRLLGIDDESFYNIVANYYSRNGRVKEAVLEINKAVKTFDCSNPLTYLNKGRIELKEGKVEYALQYFDKALAISPNLISAKKGLATVYFILNRIDEYQALILELKPTDSNVSFDCIVDSFEYLVKNDFSDRAIREYQLLLKDYPSSAKLHHSIGLALLGSESKLSFARTALIKAFWSDRSNPKIRLELSFIYRLMGKRDRFESYLDRAKRWDLENKAIDWLFVENFFYHGDYSKAWDLFSCRYDAVPGYFCFHDTIDKNKFFNDTHYSLLVFSEQGVGDEIMYSHCLQDLPFESQELICILDKRLYPLYARSFPKIRFYPKLDINQTFTYRYEKKYQSNVGTLCGYMRENAEKFQNKSGYLKACPLKVAQYKNVLKTSVRHQFTVGISWRTFASSSHNLRSIPLSCWEIIDEFPEIQFLNIQYGEVMEEVNAFNRSSQNQIMTLPGMDLKDDLDDLAALIMACDAVISIDNTTLHFSGALGQKTWGLLQAGHEFRWGEHKKTVWYDSVDLIRQDSYQDWRSVFRTLMRELESYLQTEFLYSTFD